MLRSYISSAMQQLARPPVPGVLLVAAVLLGMWAAAQLIPRVTAWKELHSHYPATQGFSGRLSRFNSAYVGSQRFDACVVGGANGDGLYLNMHVAMFPGSQPLFVPWDRVEVHTVRVGMSSLVEVSFRDVPSATVKLRTPLVEWLRQESGGAFPQSVD